MDGRAWWAAVHGVVTSRTRLSDFTFTFHFHALEKEMAAHSSVLAWRIPGTGEAGGLPSMGSHRVRHDWLDSAAAAAVPALLMSSSSLLAFAPCLPWVQRTVWTVRQLASWTGSTIQMLCVDWASPGGSDGKESACNARDQVSSWSWEDPLDRGMATHFRYSCLGNSMDGGVWWAAVHGVVEGWTRLSDFYSLCWLRSLLLSG